MLKNYKLGVILGARDLGRARKFYTGMLGMEINPQMDDENGFGVMAADDTGAYIYKTDMAPAQATAAGFLIDDGKLEDMVKALSAKGLRFEMYGSMMPGIKQDKNGIAEMGGVKTAWFKDTEGNIIALNQM